MTSTMRPSSKRGTPYLSGSGTSFSNTLAEVTIGIAYHEDPAKAIATIERTLQSVGGFDPERAPKVGIESFGDSSVNLCIRAWLPTNLYYENFYKINQAVFAALRADDIDIPFPQQEVRILNREQLE